MRCKPGCLAYVVHAADPEMIGKPVKVLKIDDFHTERWATTTWLIECDPFKGSAPGKHRKIQTPHPDAWLRPITGLPSSEVLTRFVDITVKVTA